MDLMRIVYRTTGVVLLAVSLATVTFAQQPFTEIAVEVNKKLVKLFGAGGFKGLPSYGTGILVSPKGYILTCNNHILTSSNLRVQAGRVPPSSSAAKREGSR